MKEAFKLGFGATLGVLVAMSVYAAVCKCITNAETSDKKEAESTEEKTE